MALAIDVKDPSGTFVRRDFAAPLWMLALFAGTWPLASIAPTIARKDRAAPVVGKPFHETELRSALSTLLVPRRKVARSQHFPRRQQGN